MAAFSSGHGPLAAGFSPPVSPRASRVLRHCITASACVSSETESLAFSKPSRIYGIFRGLSTVLCQHLCQGGGAYQGMVASRMPPTGTEVLSKLNQSPPVSSGLEEQLMQCCSAPQPKLPDEFRCSEQLDEGTCQGQILLDLGFVEPRCVGSPCGDVGLGNHVSTSMGWFTIQAGSAMAGCGGRLAVVTGHLPCQNPTLADDFQGVPVRSETRSRPPAATDSLKV